MDNVKDMNTSLCDLLLELSKSESTETIKKHLNNYSDTEAFAALSALRSKSAKTDLLYAEFLLNGSGCEKNETEAGKVYAGIVSRFEEQNEFPPEYSEACYMAADLLYSKVNSFELNLGFAIDYDRRGAKNGKSEKCLKRYEQNMTFLRKLRPDIYPNEEMLYKVAAFVLQDHEKKQVTDNYWNALKDKAQKIQNAYFLKYFSPLLSSADEEKKADAERFIKEHKYFPDGSELYQKEEARKTRPSLTASGSKKSELFSKISVSYNQYEEVLSDLFKTRMAAERKEKYEEKLGAKDFDFWSSEEKVQRALDVLKRMETYENAFGAQPAEFWENDAVFFKYVEALSRKEKFSSFLGERSWEFWLSDEKVNALLKELEEKRTPSLKSKTKSRRLIFLLLVFVLSFIVFSLLLFALLRYIPAAILSAFSSAFILTAIVYFKLKKHS